MTPYPNLEYLNSLVNELRHLPDETEWVEFKVNNTNPEEIGEYISAISNSAALYSKTNGYIIWGIKDKTHEITGTDFTPKSTKKGNENLENWFMRLLTPRINFRFYECIIDEKKVVILEVPRAFQHPVRFKEYEYIRIGSYKKKLKDFPEKERELWNILNVTPFEKGVALNSVSGDEVLRIIDYPAYFDLLKLPLPSGKEGILESLSADEIILPVNDKLWNITNLGTLLFSKNMSEIQTLKRKAVRVIVYKGNSRIETEREHPFTKGYASGFKSLVEYIITVLPSEEVLSSAIRKNEPMYPEIAIRELLANALIHQDFSVTGAGVTVEIFDDRMEITNPGKPLMDTRRFLDYPPRSRNEDIAAFLRRVGICEERGSGVDKVVFQTELKQLPAPLFETGDDFTRAILFGQRPLTKMDKNDRIRACYLHACLKYVNREDMTNQSLRIRFGIAEKNSAMASRIIKETVEADYIKPYDETTSKRYMKYIPYWTG